MEALDFVMTYTGGRPPTRTGAMRIAVDCMGGDHGPEVVVRGVKMALDRYSADRAAVPLSVRKKRSGIG